MKRFDIPYEIKILNTLKSLRKKGINDFSVITEDYGNDTMIGITYIQNNEKFILPIKCNKEFPKIIKEYIKMAKKCVAHKF